MTRKTLSPGEECTVSVALVDKRSLRLDFRDDEVVVGAKPVIVYSVSWLEVLPNWIDSTRRMPALRQELLP